MYFRGGVIDFRPPSAADYGLPAGGYCRIRCTLPVIIINALQQNPPRDGEVVELD
jgi:hypothetical protein